MSDDEPPDARVAGKLCRLTRGAMAPAVGFLFHRRFKGRFMHHDVHALGQSERRRARGRIAKNRQFFCRAAVAAR